MTQRLQVQYVSRCKVPNKGGKREVLERVCKLLLRSKAKFSLSKQSVKFKCQIRFEIAKKYAKKYLDVSSL